MARQRVHLIAAARPNFMKVAPLWHALSKAEDFEPVLIHTGQHYDANMSEQIFVDLGLPEPHHHLGVGSGTHAEQTGRTMIAYERIASEARPDWIVVVGDVNATVAGALVGAKLGLRVVHLEAGLRSHDRSMPEEINRLATDAVADVLWTPSPDADANLRAEGAADDRISRVGNIMIDSFEMVRPRIEAENRAEALGLAGRSYAVVTLHRPSNVDDPAKLGALIDALCSVQSELPIVFPVHPRTSARLAEFGLAARLDQAGVKSIDPLPYIQFMSLVVGAAAAITDSGGIQEETTYLGIPCLTLRENTERPITIHQGTNRLVRADSLLLELRHALGRRPPPRRPDRWDGKTAERCVEDLRRRSAST